MVNILGHLKNITECRNFMPQQCFGYNKLSIGFINAFLLRSMLSNRNSSQKDSDSLIVTRRGICLTSTSALTSHTATPSHTRSSMRVNTPDMSQADALVMVQVPGPGSSHICGRDRDTVAELTRSNSDIETVGTRKGVVRVIENLLCDEAENVSEMTPC